MKSLEPFVSVVIPVENGEVLLAKRLSSQRGQDDPGERFEIITADGRGTDRGGRVVKNAAPGVVLFGLDCVKVLKPGGRFPLFRVDGSCFLSAEKPAS
jgi:hypothetical protein